MAPDPRKMYLIMDEQEEKHDQPWPSYHIETPRRLESTGLYSDSRIHHLPRREATLDEIESVHTKRYVQDVKSTETMTVVQQEQFCTNYEDIYVNSATWRRAKLAAASAIDLAIECATHKKPGIAFVRPPGHHAMPDEGCGFCIFNNVAIAAKQAIKRGVAKRVLIVDYDVHAANGTQECIEGEEGIQLISIHRYEHGKFWPNMPQTGIYHKYKNTMNLPLNATGMSDREYFALFSHIILPVAYSYRPDLILVSSGFDASIGDPEGYMNVTPSGFATMIRKLMDTGVPVAAILEGGYFLDALAADSEYVVRAMLGEAVPKSVELSLRPHPLVAETISRIYQRYQNSFPFFRKVQELRELLLETKFDTRTEQTTDYTGERVVCAPYDTRGIYTPLSDEKVDEFRKELAEILNEDKLKKLENFDEKMAKPLEFSTGTPTNCLKYDDDLEKIVFGDGNAVRLFATLLFRLPFDPLFALGHIPDTIPNFQDIQLHDSLKEIRKDIKFFCLAFWVMPTIF
uniref:Histone deacetylase n=2 Tax=Caenorhabditis japonica TaxID=281687 RepID=A0A8R1HPF9_CAEJA